MEQFSAIVDRFSAALGLGKYGLEVLSSYVISLALLGILVWLSARRSKRIAAQLAAVETRVKDKTDG